METIEKALFDLSSRNSEFTEKQVQNVAKVVYTTAESSSKSSNNLDSLFKKHFPEINDLGTVTDKPNPHFVIEFKDGKPLKEFTGWNHEIGILPNHRYIGKYYIDIGTEVNENAILYCTSHKKKIEYIKCGTCNNNPFNNYNNINTISCCSSSSSLLYSCGCKINNQTRYCPGILKNIIHITNQIPCAPQARSEDRHLFFTDKTIEFEVDNYLNLYHKPSGLYLMFNKTAFPLFPFYNKKYIFQSKRLNNISFDFNHDFYRSIDRRGELLEKINELIPTDYHQVYDYFNRFRMFPQYKTTLDLSDCKINESDIEHDDPKDRIIEELKTKLSFVMEKVNKSNEIIDTMTEDYSKHSVKIKELERQLSGKDEEIVKLKSEYKNNTVDEIEKLKVELFNMNKVLLEKTNIELQKQALGKDIDNIKLELKTTSKKLNKMRDINNGMIEQIKQLKTSNKDLTEQNTFVTKEFNELKCDFEKEQTKIKEHVKTINEKEVEYNKLLEQVSNQGKNSSDSLEQALSDQLDIIKTQKDEMETKYRQLLNEKNTLQQEINRYKSTLGKLLN